MCTVVTLRRPGHAWPVMMAANRDERTTRPWRRPARHWDDRPTVVGGFDDLAGGSWMGVNDDGVVAVLLNRRGTLGPEEGKRSRGELVLEALDHTDAIDAALALGELNAEAYRPFNLVVADNRDAYWLANRGPDARKPGHASRVEIRPLPEGFSLLAADDLDDPACPRSIHLGRFRTAPVPDPDRGAWESWEDLLASRLHDPDAGPKGAMCVVTDIGFGTVSSSLLALPAAGRAGARPIWRFAAGRPGEVPYLPIGLAPWSAVHDLDGSD